MNGFQPIRSPNGWISKNALAILNIYLWSRQMFCDDFETFQHLFKKSMVAHFMKYKKVNESIAENFIQLVEDELAASAEKGVK